MLLMGVKRKINMNQRLAIEITMIRSIMISGHFYRF